MITRLTAVLLAVVLAVGACSSQDSPTAGSSTGTADSSAPAAPTETDPVATAPEPEATPAPTTTEVDPSIPTPWSEAIDAFDPEGEPNVEAALTLFTMALGPIDGFPEPPPNAGASGDVTIAFRAVAGVWDQLSEEQRVAVMSAAHGDPASSTVVELGSGTSAGLMATQRRAAAPDPKLVTAITDAAQDLRTQIAAKIGDFTGTLTVIVASADNSAKDLGMATPDVLPNGTYSGNCTFTIFPNATSGDVYLLLNTLAHEIFHCFQFSGFGSNAAFAKAPGWVVEGGAEWVAGTITAPDRTTANRWLGWFKLADAPLMLKKYSAIGFWAHLAESGTDPWSVFRSVWAAGPTPAAFDAAGANSPAFLDSWASGMTRKASFPPGWDTTGPGITDDTIDIKDLAVGAPGQAAVTAAPYTTSAYAISTEADVLEFTATGNARVSDGTVDLAALAGTRFCKRPEGCTCPNVPDDIPPAPIGEPVLALSGGPSGSAVTVIGLTLELHCEEREHRPVQVTLDRPGSQGVLAGQVLQLTSCTGVWGTWSGVLRLGGLSLDGFEVPFQEIPLSFTVSGTGTQTVQAATGGVIQTPVFPVEVHYDLSITVDGTTMSIAGTGSGANDMFSVEVASPSELSSMPIVDAPEGACPDA